jgi:hypothetical protein
MTNAAPASTNIADLRNAPTVRAQHNVVAGFNDMQSFELLQRVGKLLAASSLVPEVYRGAEGLPNAIVALNMAQRMGADPLMVMQNLYVVHGRPAWSAQFLIATFNHSGRYTSIRYRWQGTEGKDDWGCRAYATEKESGNEITGPLVTIALAKAEKWTERTGSKWKTIPELMLTYRAAAWMVRTNAPEIAMGLPTTDEIDDLVTVTPAQYSVLQVAEGEHAKAAATVAPAEGAELTYAQVAEAINAAESPDAIESAKALLMRVADEAQRAELDVTARAKAKAISAELDKRAQSESRSAA